MLLVPAIWGAETPKSVDQILADYENALGGRAAIDAIQTREVRGSTKLLGKVDIFWQAPDKVLLINGKEKAGYNGAGGWSYSKRKRMRRMVQGEQVPIEIDGNPLRYVHLHQMHPDLQSEPQKTIDGQAMDVLVAPNNLAASRYYFNAETHLLERIEEKGETSAYFTHTTLLGDYRKVDRIQFPFRIIQRTTDKGGEQQDLKVKDVENNVELDSQIFDKPQSAKLVLGGKR